MLPSQYSSESHSGGSNEFDSPSSLPCTIYREQAVHNEQTVFGDVYMDSEYDHENGLPPMFLPPPPPELLAHIPAVTDLSRAYPILPLGSNLELNNETGQHILNLPNMAPTVEEDDMQYIIRSHMSITGTPTDGAALLHPDHVADQPLLSTENNTALIPQPVPAHLREWIDETTRNAGVAVYSQIPGTGNYGPAQKVYTLLLLDGKIVGFYSHQDPTPLPLPENLPCGSPTIPPLQLDQRHAESSYQREAGPQQRAIDDSDRRCLEEVTREQPSPPEPIPCQTPRRARHRHAQFERTPPKRHCIQLGQRPPGTVATNIGVNGISGTSRMSHRRTKSSPLVPILEVDSEYSRSSAIDEGDGTWPITSTPSLDDCQGPALSGPEVVRADPTVDHDHDHDHNEAVLKDYRRKQSPGRLRRWSLSRLLPHWFRIAI